MQVRCHSCGHIFDALAGSVRASCPGCGAQIDVTSMETRASPAGGARPSAANADRLIGQVLGGYRLVSLIGSGGMGVVFAAERTEGAGGEGPPTAAIKVLSPSISDHDEFVIRFQREARALTHLRHPNLIEVFAHGTEELSLDGEPRLFHFFVMEHFDGEDLRVLIRRGGLRPGAMTAIIQGAAAGLAAAHSAGVVHRDVKPANILVKGDPSEGGLVKVVDFGVAHIALGEYTVTDLTSSELLLGTVNYMAPEQRIDAQQIDARADVYALGVVAYELLTGQLPIGAFETPSALVPELPRSIDEPILWALQRSPDRRCPDVSTLAARLERAIDRRAPSQLIMFGAAAALLIAVGGGAYLSVNSGERPASRVEPVVEQIDPAAEQLKVEASVAPLAETIVEAIGQAEKIQAEPPEPELEILRKQDSKPKPTARRKKLLKELENRKNVAPRGMNQIELAPKKKALEQPAPEPKQSVSSKPFAK